MAAPGTAYDDPRLGKDPQPANMSDYVETTEDSGGVHINSGIPNRAFYLVATELGGNAWSEAGRIWYATLTSGNLPDTADFTTFAEATQSAATTLYGADSPQLTAVTTAWQEVGVLSSAGDEPKDEVPASSEDEVPASSEEKVPASSEDEVPASSTESADLMRAANTTLDPNTPPAPTAPPSTPDTPKADAPEAEPAEAGPPKAD
jgi:hypothetical protein